MACKSPLTTSGMRPGIAESDCISRSCCDSQPRCQYGLGLSSVNLPSGPKISGYHSPHFPALHPGGLDGTFTRWMTSRVAARAFSQASTSGATKTPVGPARVTVRLTKEGPRRDAHNARCQSFRRAQKDETTIGQHCPILEALAICSDQAGTLGTKDVAWPLLPEA